VSALKPSNKKQKKIEMSQRKNGKIVFFAQLKEHQQQHRSSALSVICMSIFSNTSSFIYPSTFLFSAMTTSSERVALRIIICWLCVLSAFFSASIVWWLCLFILIALISSVHLVCVILDYRLRI